MPVWKSALVPIFALAASCASAQILNSERIEQTFGSYGIDVLYSDEALRISNLYSEHDGDKITRTLAFVEYPAVVDAAFAAEHQLILNGGSIGSTFTAAGWNVIKEHLSIVEFSTPAEFADLMGVDNEARIATHFYQLDIEKNGERFTYASIAEQHHPDYLGIEDLTTIYPIIQAPVSLGSSGVSSQSGEFRRRHLDLIDAAIPKLREPGLALGQ